MSGTKTLLGFIAGAAAGAVAGILLAPDKGSATWKKVTKRAGNNQDAAGHRLTEEEPGNAARNVVPKMQADIG